MKLRPARYTRRPALICAAVVAQLAAGCGYFNSLYNAQQKFAEAERADATGQRGAALAAYDEVIKRAAVSYQKYPNSRWADDALLLIGRAHFLSANDRQAAAALEHLLAETKDPAIRSEALAVLGAARVRLNLPSAAAALDSAVAQTDAHTELGAFSRLWRARARFNAADVPGGWQDLETVSADVERVGADAAMERLSRAVTLRDSVRWLREVNGLIAQQVPSRWADSVRALLTTSVSAWTPRFVNTALPADVGNGLPEAQRLEMRLLRAELAGAAGDTSAAIADGMRVATASGTDVSMRARVRVAQWSLGQLGDPADLGRVRAILVPAFANSEAFAMIRQLRTVEVLMDRAGAEPLAMFVAAEFARDELHAPRLARALFSRFEALPAATAWDGKALLAALDLVDTSAQREPIERRIAALGNDVYIAAVRGEADSTAFATAETLLKRDAALLRAEAVALANEGNVSVGRAVAVRDSVRAIARRDSVTTHCGVVIDSLKIRGIRADSARVACVRMDNARFNEVLRIDTTKLRAVKPDSIRSEGRPRSEAP